MRTPLEVVVENTAYTRAQQKNPETDASLREWRAQWKRQLRNSTFFLDHIESSSFSIIRAHLALLGARFSSFFDRDVTHIITRRSLDHTYSESDVLTRAKQLGAKVWTLEKLERFLTSLLGHSPRKQLTRVDSTKLGQLLQKEKLVGGPGDKEQWVHFSDPYVLVYDPTSRHKPLVHKEWKTGWPQLYPETANGICPFVLCKKTQKRLMTTEDENQQIPQDEEDSANKRQALNVLYDDENCSNIPQAAGRQTTLRTRQYGEIVASGIQRTGVTSAINTNAPQEQFVPSREVATLQRKVLPPPKPKKVKKVRKPGFCENCYERYDNIDDHVLTMRHRRYAKDERNFESLDRIIEAYRRPTPFNSPKPTNDHEDGVHLVSDHPMSEQATSEAEA